MSEQMVEISKTVREKYRKEVEEPTGVKVRNVFFLTSGLDGGDYFVFTSNNGKLFKILRIDGFGTKDEFHRWI